MFAVVFAAALWLPMLVALFEPRLDRSVVEGRMLAQWPTFGTEPDWGSFARQVERYAGDHFGARESLIALNATLRNALRSPVTPLVAFGRDGALFYTGDKVFQQSTGQIARRDGVREFAQFIADLRARCARSGSAFVAAFPPNNHTSNRARLPRWARQRSATTEYDLLLSELVARGVPALDLRPVLERGQQLGPVAQPRDTHWTSLGGLLAFDAIVRKLGRTDWAIDPQGVLRPRLLPFPGDLERMAMIRDPRNWTTDLVGPALPHPTITYPADTVTLAVNPAIAPGDRVLIIGDSSTESLFPLLASAHAHEAMFVHLQACSGFDATVFETYRPTVVIFAPTERAFCFLR